MYCPRCLVEYRTGFTTCTDCETMLVAGDPPEAVVGVSSGDASMAEVLVTSDPLHADLVAATLQEDGIEPVVRTRFAGGLTLTASETHWAPGQQRVVLVPALAHGRARELIESIGPQSPDTLADIIGNIDASEPSTVRRRLGTRMVATMVVAPVLAAIAYGAYTMIVDLLHTSTHPTVAAAVTLPSPAVRALRSACNDGNSRACVNLGVAYETGEGISANPAQAAALYRDGCERGVLIGCINLGLLYEKGKGIAPNVTETARLYQKACDGRAMPGCFNLGTAYQRGVGVPVDLVRAARLYREACYGGYSYACVSLAYCYRTGSGVSQSTQEAIRLYRVACDAEVMSGCYNLGVSYHRGEGVENDPVEAARLYKLACVGGYALACDQVRE